MQKLFACQTVSLINNGSIALQIALQAFKLKGKVITTPFSFVATANSILQARLEPVFVDIQEGGFNLDPELVYEVLDKDICAVMPVHVYGLPCDNEGMKHAIGCSNTKLIYDAAHAFNVNQNGEAIVNWGDASVLSFHATKVFHTFEGGAIVAPDPELKYKVQSLRSFGFVDGGDVQDCGTNGKMNEAQAAMGIALLNRINDVIQMRKAVHDRYLGRLQGIEGIMLLNIPSGIDHNYGYFPILIEPGFPLSRDELFEAFCKKDIYTRKYFYPLITDFSLYKSFKTFSKHKITLARRMADSVICLPLYPNLAESDVDRICDVIIQIRYRSGI